MVAGTIELPNAIKLSTFEEMLSLAIHSLHTAVCFSDMRQPGAHVVDLKPSHKLRLRLALPLLSLAQALTILLSTSWCHQTRPDF